jgi:acetyltransferase-like isoleucine patch superfamily enzyme
MFTSIESKTTFKILEFLANSRCSVSVHDDAPVFIGDRTLVGPSVCICTGTHDVDPSIRQEQGGSFARAIRIGDDCWIGARAVILPGVTIGDGSIVAAGAVVSKDVASNCVVGGVPARVIRHLDSGKVTRGLPGPDAILLS